MCQRIDERLSEGARLDIGNRNSKQTHLELALRDSRVKLFLDALEESN